MPAPFDTETQAIVNTIIAQRNAALDQIVLMSGRIAVLEADLKGQLDMKKADAVTDVPE